MITIIFAPPRTGKTCFMTHLLNECAFNKDRNNKMAKEIIRKNSKGFNLSIPKHCVSSNYSIGFRKFGYRLRPSRVINPFRLGFDNPFVKTHFNLPYEVIGITEAQKYLNSRMSMYFPEWQSRWYEQHGHNNLDIYLDTQRPMLIDVNIRELAQFIEIVNLRLSYDNYGRVNALIDSAANQKTLAGIKSVTELFYDNGILVNPKVNKDMFSGIERVKSYLKINGGKPRLFIFKNCVNLIRELKSYRWGEGDNPKKYDDHSLDELRYYIMTKPSLSQPKKEKSIITRDKERLYKKIRSNMRMWRKQTKRS